MQPLYNREGRAVAYISDNGISIYFYDGEPAGWVYQESLVFAYSGKFLGWLMYGWLCDPQGNPAFFTDRSSGGPKRPARQSRPLRAPRGGRPPRRQRQVRPARPGMTSTWSAISDESFFAAPPDEAMGPLEVEGAPAEPGGGDTAPAVSEGSPAAEVAVAPEAEDAVAPNGSPEADDATELDESTEASDPAGVNDPAGADDPPERTGGP